MKRMALDLKTKKFFLSARGCLHRGLSFGARGEAGR